MKASLDVAAGWLMIFGRAILLSRLVCSSHDVEHLPEAEGGKGWSLSVAVGQHCLSTNLKPNSPAADCSYGAKGPTVYSQVFAPSPDAASVCVAKVPVRFLETRETFRIAAN